jgi:hypothetical protein
MRIEQSTTSNSHSSPDHRLESPKREFVVPSVEELKKDSERFKVLQAAAKVDSHGRVRLENNDKERIRLYFFLNSQINCAEPLKENGVTPEAVRRMSSAQIMTVLIPDEYTRNLLAENIRLANDILG